MTDSKHATKSYYIIHNAILTSCQTNMEKLIRIQVGRDYKFRELIVGLDSLGYERADYVSEPGHYKPLGGVLTVWPVDSSQPFAVDFFGDTVELIKELPSTNKIDKLNISSNIITYDDGTIIRPGNYIVHVDHGIGLYKRRGVKEVDGKKIEYIFLEYFNGDYLYLPVNLKDKITKYIGIGKKPKLNKLGTQTWAKTKKKAYENALRLAKELLQIYAKREVSKKEPYKIDRQWDKSITNTFGYVETSDQLSAIRDVYDDLSKDVPMDRLVSGDVGYGKTEVALRAITQAVANHKQAIVICPTTILAQQHYSNIVSRMSNLPVNVSMLSRFVKSDKQKSIVEDVSQGRVDVLVGTHRLFSKDIKFANLDMVIIDEEQRFGVKQKEYFKKLRANVNVISLSATPIPRTLFMSLSGIRDISQILTAPKGRKSIDTEISKYDEEKIAEYIRREINRGGQIYYLYNRVETIRAVSSKVQKIVPEARIVVAHGQMGEQALSDTMEKFVRNEADVLLCTTIIENGLDLPNVNTLIVEEADHYGLSQLYQIRGRIGRSEKQAYALLTHKHKELTQNAFKRLKSLVDNSALGSGFNIALSDLEIRGGGNILGREQHGNMEEVGLVLYSQLLARAVKKVQP